MLSGSDLTTQSLWKAYVALTFRASLAVWLLGASTTHAQGTDAAKQAAIDAAKRAAASVVAPRLRPVELATPESEAAPAWNQPFKQIANIDWSTPIAPRYVNVGSDYFLFDTRQGVQQWDFATRQLRPLKLLAAQGGQLLTKLPYGGHASARLGGATGQVDMKTVGGLPTGTVFLASTGDGNQRSLLWWNPAKLAVAASLPVTERTDRASMVQLTSNYALFCDKKTGASVVRVVQRGADAVLEWATDSDPLAKAVLLNRGVVGVVKGFSKLERRSIQEQTLPVFYDAARCEWDLHNPPIALKPYFDKATQNSIKPYFLANGSVLVPELSYHDGEYPQNIQSSYLWTPGAKQWTQLGATLGRGNETHRVGQTEPVFAIGFQSSVIEFFDTVTLQWIRSVETLKLSQYDEAIGASNIEPLRSGKALVIIGGYGGSSYPGTIGVMTTARGNTPPGRLLTSRWIFGEVPLPNNQMLLVGGGGAWNPTGRIELVDIAKNQARALTALPAGPSLPVDASGASLPDGSVLIFAGLPARCSRDYYYSGNGTCANRNGLPSTRYWPETQRMESLPLLKIPFSWGAHWQTGNSDLVAQWPRADVVVRPDGKLVWLEGADFPERKDREAWPRATQLKIWSHLRAELPAQNLAALRKARSRATLINLADGRLAAIGGDAQLELVALEKDCLTCPDEFVSIGPFSPARSTEVLDETNPQAPRWTVGPLANFAGGKAFKLANGRIFKLSLAGVFDSDGYRAEVADAAFKAWEKLPAVPKIKTKLTSVNSPESMLIRNVNVVGNRVLMLTNQKLTMVWDDDKYAWLVWKDWPAGTENDYAQSINPASKAGEVFIRYGQSFQTTLMPE